MRDIAEAFDTGVAPIQHQLEVTAAGLLPLRRYVLGGAHVAAFTDIGGICRLLDFLRQPERDRLQPAPPSLMRTTMKMLFALMIAAMPLTTHALDAKDLAGTWNVTATGSKDSNCQMAAPGSIDANVWIISADAEGAVEVVVQGNTAFPQLYGNVQADAAAVILQSATLSSSAWFRLASLDGKTLIGTKRVIARSGSTAGSGPCFVDYAVEAKKQ